MGESGTGRDCNQRRRGVRRVVPPEWKSRSDFGKRGRDLANVRETWPMRARPGQCGRERADNGLDWQVLASTGGLSPAQI